MTQTQHDKRARRRHRHTRPDIVKRWYGKLRELMLEKTGYEPELSLYEWRKLWARSKDGRMVLPAKITSVVWDCT